MSSLKPCRILSPFGRGNRLGRAADFTAIGQRYQQQRGNGGKYYTFQQSRYQYPRQGDEGQKDEEEDFQLVDTTKAPMHTKRFVNSASKRRQHSQSAFASNQCSKAAKCCWWCSWTGYDAACRTRRRLWCRSYVVVYEVAVAEDASVVLEYGNRVDRQPSVAVQSDWKKVEDNDLGKITKRLPASTGIPEPQDVSVATVFW